MAPRIKTPLSMEENTRNMLEAIWEIGVQHRNNLVTDNDGVFVYARELTEPTSIQGTLEAFQFSIVVPMLLAKEHGLTFQNLPDEDSILDVLITVLGRSPVSNPDERFGVNVYQRFRTSGIDHRYTPIVTRNTIGIQENGFDETPIFIGSTDTDGQIIESLTSIIRSLESVVE